MMKNALLSVLLTLLMCLLHTRPLQAHGGTKHGKASQTEDKAQKPDTSAIQRVAPEKHAAHVEEPAMAHARPGDFPNKQHPLVVHFPIVLLLVAAAVILFLRRELDWITTVATLISFGTAYYVTNIDHPHTAGLTAHTKLVLDQHDRYAAWTVCLGGAGLVAQLLNQFLFRGRRWSVAVVALILAGAAYSVAMAGHYGAQLVHIEGVGPQGKYLETDHH